MVGFSQTLGYAVQILTCLSATEPRLGKTLSSGAAVPKPYMAKLINRLAKAGLVETKRGRRGGILLAKHPAMITLLDIVQAVEGKHWIEPSLLSMDTCVVLGHVPLEDLWREFVSRLEAGLKGITLAELIRHKEAKMARLAQEAASSPSPPQAASEAAALKEPPGPSYGASRSQSQGGSSSTPLQIEGTQDWSDIDDGPFPSLFGVDGR
ncbi:MAG: Rrf2 family transcriptional regulator [Verrucomicrobia bacterium]|nr:MAG: Rrf2 family transcriptional regulator [Verrucomicrobiota bacterium]